MAIKANASDQQVVGTTLYTGIAPVMLMAVNPTMDGLQKMGINAQKEPEYTSMGDDGTQKVRIDIWLKTITGPTVLNKATFFLENKGRISKDKGTYQYINNFGQSTWALTAEEAVEKVGKNGNKWFKPEGVRVALGGEVQLMEFLINLFNVRPTEEVVLDNIQNLFKGNYKELQSYTGFNYRMKALAVVKDGKYQSFYNGWSARYTNAGAAKDLEAYVARQTKSGYPIKEDFSYAFQEYAPVIPDVAPMGDIPAETDTPDF